jgi:pilus assembly protein CpaE
MNNLRITILSPDKQHLDEMQAALLAAAGTNHITAIDGALHRAGELAKQLAADILIAECSGAGVDELAPLGRVAELHPAMAVIVVCNRQSPEFLIQAMRLGVREVLAFPLDAPALQAAIERIHSRAGSPATAQAKVIAFTSCKGGSGATFLASNLAYMLSSQGQGTVALIDVNLQFGDAHMFLTEREATHTLSDVVRGIHRLDAALLKASMLNLGPRLAVLAAPDDPSHGLEARPEHVESLLALARKHFDYIILDVGRTVDAASVRALDHADLIYAVLQANLPFVRGARRMLDVFRSLEYPQQKVELVINRHEKNSDLRIKDIEHALGRRIDRAIPNDYAAVAASVNQGVPIEQSAHGSPVSGALMQWCEQLQGRPASDHGNWIARVFKRGCRTVPAAPKDAANASIEKQGE